MPLNHAIPSKEVLSFDSNQLISNQDEIKEQAIIEAKFLASYVGELNQQFKTGIAKEHAYRPALVNLIQQICPEITATNDSELTKAGRPDLRISKTSESGLEAAIGYFEAKDLGDDLEDKKNFEQFENYRQALPNIGFTNYLTFQFYFQNQLKAEISIAKIENGKIIALHENFAEFSLLLQDFCSQVFESINSPKQLAQMMARKARLLALKIQKALDFDRQNGVKSEIAAEFESFCEVLIADLQPKDFADVYAQTIAYGMFAARLHDESGAVFSRSRAADLIPKTNPFLRKLFANVAGSELDERIRQVVDDLASVFVATDMAAVLENFGKDTEQEDPVLHFYETFLQEFDPILRKNRGVWYTPKPVVEFIVRAVDEILKNDFDLKYGLGDTTKISHPTQENSEIHKVQILDPATGTGTFLSEVILQIQQKFRSNLGAWSGYVDEHLIPRLNGFEILMASYVMAHLKLDLLLQETGYKPSKSQAQNRFRIFLTNSLEEPRQHDAQNGNLMGLMRELTNEAREASKVKNETPVMVILGNPPYSGESQNKSNWINEKMKDYKREPATEEQLAGKLQEKLKEKNPKWLNDDYVKFIRFAQFFIEKNQEGVVAFINPHGFLDNPTFRGMRHSLLSAFDKIYTIDLHGNSKKKEVAPDGSKDENVFNIQQGVSINIFVKRKDLNNSSHLDGQEFNNSPLGEESNERRSFGGGSENYPTKSSLKLNKAISNPSPNSQSIGSSTLPQGEGLRNSSPQLAKSNEPQFAALKIKSQKPLAQIFHFDLFGKRADKYRFLRENSLATIPFRALAIRHPMYFMCPKNFEFEEEYQSGFLITDLMPLNSVGIVTAKDEVLINSFKKELLKNVEKFYQIKTDEDLVKKICYRPFDERLIYYNQKLLERPRTKVMKHFLAGENWGLVFKIGNSEANSAPIHCTKNLIDFRSWSRPGMQGGDYIAPLFTYQDQTTASANDLFFEKPKRKANLNPEIVAKIAEKLQLAFVEDESGTKTDCHDFASQNLAGYELEEIGRGKKAKSANYFTPLNLLDYVYGSLHDPNYRKKFAEFLKIDFPRIPFPKDAKKFFAVAEIGKNLREIHLLESQKLEGGNLANFPIAGSNKVEKTVFEKSEESQASEGENEVFDELKNEAKNRKICEKTQKIIGKVFINDSQFFENVPLDAFEFFIGGYQPAQKWLKDRKEKILGFDEILHYQKIIRALDLTAKLMDRLTFLS